MRLFLPLLLGLAACGQGDVMSCANDDEPVTNCIEFSNFDGGLLGLGLKASMTTLCTAIGAKVTSEACPTDGLVGGCAGDEQGTYDYIEWAYESSDVSSLDDISCNSDEEKVDATGSPADGAGDTDVYLHDTCSAQSSTSVTPTFTNNHTTDVTLYWIDFDCAQAQYPVIAMGGSVPQQTFADHVWIAREGSGDPDGTILWEGTISAADDGQTLSIP